MISNWENLGVSERRQISLILRLIAMANAQSDTLAAHVVLYRALGIGKPFALACMEELSRRRILGEIFEFEEFIEQEIKKIKQPQPTDLGMINNVLSFKNILNIVESTKNQGSK